MAIHSLTKKEELFFLNKLAYLLGLELLKL